MRVPRRSSAAPAGPERACADHRSAWNEWERSSPAASHEIAAVGIEETRTLRVALAPGLSDRYWLHAEGSEFVAEVARWTVRELLEAAVEDFQAPEKETPEIVEVDDTDDSNEMDQTNETDDTREDDATGVEGEEGETRQDDGGEAS